MNKENFFKQIGQFKKSAAGKVPRVKTSEYLLRDIIALLFPIFSRKEEFSPEKELEKIEKRTHEILQNISFSNEDAENISEKFINTFEKIYHILINDAQAIFEGDPAAETIEEVIVAYPGFYAILIHRIAHELYLLQVPVLPRLFSEYAHKKTGIDIHPGARIGEYFCIDHGTGIVIGETTEIGDHVKIYQGVTLGALSVSKEKAGTKRHPDIGHHVTIYSGSTILGGKTHIGHHSVIGGNVWLTQSVDPHTVVLNKSEVYLKNNQSASEEMLHYII
jgi:serine O-acetyltransferase